MGESAVQTLDCIDFDCDGEWHTCIFCDGAGYLDRPRGGPQLECDYCQGEGGFDCPAERGAA